jgi:hypothetical protein
MGPSRLKAKQAKWLLRPFLRKSIARFSDQRKKRSKFLKKRPLFASDVTALRLARKDFHAEDAMDQEP